MDFDAFDAGIEPGGLRNATEIKILICYILKSINKPLTKDIIIESIQEEGLANYFEANQALSNLLETENIKLIASESGDSYAITELGKKAAAQLETALPYTIRNKAIKTATSLLTQAMRERENKVNILKSGKGYKVSCLILDDSGELMKIELYVPDILQAENVKKNFLSDPTNVYRQILAILSGKNDFSE